MVSAYFGVYGTCILAEVCHAIVVILRQSNRGWELNYDPELRSRAHLQQHTITYWLDLTFLGDKSASSATFFLLLFN